MFSIFKNLYIYCNCCRIPDDIDENFDSDNSNTNSSKSSIESIKDKIVIILNLKKGYS